MTNMNAIRVIPFFGKAEGWTIWSERFLAKGKHCGFKDLYLCTFSIPWVDEEIDEKSYSTKKKSMIIKLNEVVYTELILLIDVKASSGKVFSTLLEDARPWIIQMVMIQSPGRDLRINENLFLRLQW
jgi:hypothetical protein